jgi:hypothetical protein
VVPVSSVAGLFIGAVVEARIVPEQRTVDDSTKSRGVSHGRPGAIRPLRFLARCGRRTTIRDDDSVTVLQQHFLSTAPVRRGFFLCRRLGSEMDEKEEAKEKLRRALQALNTPMAEREESFGLPTDKNLSLGQRLAWIKQRMGPHGRHLA